MIKQLEMGNVGCKWNKKWINVGKKKRKHRLFLKLEQTGESSDKIPTLMSNLESF